MSYCYGQHVRDMNMDYVEQLGQNAVLISSDIEDYEEEYSDEEPVEEKHSQWVYQIALTDQTITNGLFDISMKLRPTSNVNTIIKIALKENAESQTETIIYQRTILPLESYYYNDIAIMKNSLNEKEQIVQEKEVELNNANQAYAAAKEQYDIANEAWKEQGRPTEPTNEYYIAYITAQAAEEEARKIRIQKTIEYQAAEEQYNIAYIEYQEIISGFEVSFNESLLVPNNKSYRIIKFIIMANGTQVDIPNPGLIANVVEVKELLGTAAINASHLKRIGIQGQQNLRFFVNNSELTIGPTEVCEISFPSLVITSLKIIPNIISSDNENIKDFFLIDYEYEEEV